MGWFKREKEIEMKDPRPLLPEGIIEVERGYQVRGRLSVHPTISKALKQLEGMKNVR